MKVPRLWSCLLLLCAAVADGGAAAVPATTMRASAEQGVDDFLAALRAQGWRAPAMPSRWHLEQVSAAAARPAEQAARDLGGTLARRLAELAPKQQSLPPSDELAKETAALCDLADWCAATEGYGNVLLAQRCLDLAAVGVARLAANLDFPLEKIAPLAARLRMPWAGVSARRRILNAEAGSELFVAPDQAGLEQTWAAGARADASAAQRAFFTDERPGRGEPMTLAATWERKWHERLVDGFDLRTVVQAAALVEFRRAVGKFPSSDTPTTPSAAPSATAAGFQLVLPGRAQPAGQRAFQRAWADYLQTASAPRAGGRGGLSDQRLPDSAWAAFEAVQQGVFLDHETRNERFGPGAR